MARLVHSFANTRKGYWKCSRCGTEKRESGKKSPIFGATLVREYRKHGSNEWGPFIQCFDPRQVELLDSLDTRASDDPRNFPPMFKPPPEAYTYPRNDRYRYVSKPEYNPVSLDGIIEFQVSEDAYWLGIQREWLVRGFNEKGEPIGVNFHDTCTREEMQKKVELGKALIGLIRGAGIRLAAKDGAQWWHLCDGSQWLEIPWWMRVKPTMDAFLDVWNEAEPLPRGNYCTRCNHPRSDHGGREDGAPCSKCDCTGMTRLILSHVKGEDDTIEEAEIPF